MAQYFLGIDGGGTKTQAAIVDEAGNLRGMGWGGPSNYDDVGAATARDSIRQAVDQARAAAELAPEPFAAAFLGLAGVVSAEDRSTIHGIARDLELAPPERIGVDHDCRIALAGGLSGRPGIVLITGTGSSCYGRTAAGAGWRAGGWGQLISDEGSSYWLGVGALQIAVRSFDGRLDKTILLPMVQDHLALTDMNSIMRRLYVQGMSRTEIAALAPLVTTAAKAGDQAALTLIAQGAAGLADCVYAVAQRLGFDAGLCEVVLVGGLLQAGDVILQPLQAAISGGLPESRIMSAELPAVLGACLLATEGAGV